MSVQTLVNFFRSKRSAKKGKKGPKPNSTFYSPKPERDKRQPDTNDAAEYRSGARNCKPRARLKGESDIPTTDAATDSDVTVYASSKNTDVSDTSSGSVKQTSTSDSDTSVFQTDISDELGDVYGPAARGAAQRGNVRYDAHSDTSPDSVTHGNHGYLRDERDSRRGDPSHIYEEIGQAARLLSRRKQLDLEKLDIDNAKECGAYLVIPFKKGESGALKALIDQRCLQGASQSDGDRISNYELTHVNSYTLTTPSGDTNITDQPCILLDVDLLKDSKDYTQTRARNKFSFEKLCDTIEIPYNSSNDLSREEQRQIMALDAYASLPDLAKADYPWITGCDFKRPLGDEKDLRPDEPASPQEASGREPTSLSSRSKCRDAGTHSVRSGSAKHKHSSMDNIHCIQNSPKSGYKPRTGKTVTISSPAREQHLYNSQQDIYGAMDDKSKQTLQDLYSLPSHKVPHKSILKKSCSLGSLSRTPVQSPPTSPRKTSVYSCNSLPRLSEERNTPPPLPERDIVPTPLSPKSGIPYKQIGPGNKLILRENYYNTNYDILTCRFGINKRRKQASTGYYSSVDLTPRIPGIKQRLRGVRQEPPPEQKSPEAMPAHRPIIRRPSAKIKPAETPARVGKVHGNNKVAPLHYSHHDRPVPTPEHSSGRKSSFSDLHYSHHDRPARDNCDYNANQHSRKSSVDELHYSHHERPTRAHGDQNIDHHTGQLHYSHHDPPTQTPDSHRNNSRSRKSSMDELHYSHHDRPLRQDSHVRSPEVNQSRQASAASAHGKNVKHVREFTHDSAANSGRLHYSHHDKLDSANACAKIHVTTDIYNHQQYSPVPPVETVKNSYCKHVAFAGLPGTDSDDAEAGGSQSAGTKITVATPPPPITPRKCTCKQHGIKPVASSTQLVIPEPNQECVTHDKATYCDHTVLAGPDDRFIYSELYKATCIQHPSNKQDQAAPETFSDDFDTSRDEEKSMESDVLEINNNIVSPLHATFLEVPKQKQKKSKGILRHKPVSPKWNSLKKGTSRMLSDPLPRTRRSFSDFDKGKQVNFFKRTLSVPTETNTQNTRKTSIGKPKHTLLDDLIRKNHDRQLLLI